jgi:hypothetical protein
MTNEQPLTTLAEFASTLPADKQQWFMEFWGDTVRFSPKVYSLLNTPEAWQKIYTRLEHCFFICTRGCKDATTVDPLGGSERRVGCSLMAGDAS